MNFYDEDLVPSSKKGYHLKKTSIQVALLTIFLTLDRQYNKIFRRESFPGSSKCNKVFDIYCKKLLRRYIPVFDAHR